MCVWTAIADTGQANIVSLWPPAEHQLQKLLLPMPKLKLDQFEDDGPSPYAHMLLQCELICDINECFGILESPLSLQRALLLQRRIGTWVEKLPAVYAVENTDTSKDAEYTFLALQRPYLHVISYAMLLIPLKPYIISRSRRPTRWRREKPVVSASTSASSSWILPSPLRSGLPQRRQVHFSFFALFDGSALLCSAITHDVHKTLPRRAELVEYIKRGLDMLQQITHTETATAAYKVLRRSCMVWT